MKKIFLILLSFLLLNSFAAADELTEVQTYSNDDINFGLKIKDGENLTKPIYKKLVRLGNNAWIVQKGSRYGIMDNSGKYLVKPKCRHADRYFGKYVKLGNDHDFGVYDEYGKVIVKPEFSQVELLYGKMFLTCKKYKYGLVDFDGNVILKNDYDDIYMPTFKTMRIKYKGNWYEVTKERDEKIKPPENTMEVRVNDEVYFVTLLTNTGVISEYSVITLSDFVLKMLSSISPAYEDTIDDLMLSHGVDTINIFMNLSWVPQFPVVYAKKYYYQIANPHTGPLSDMRSRILQNLR
ncbi:MAG: WG repeat-containing protein [bacterium]|nr:WG repeat-containing protein [bacterium]